MKKFLTLSLTFIICIFSLTACTTREEAYQLPTETVVPEEQIKVACTALVKSRIYLELENNSDIEWTYGENRGFLIRQKGDGWAYLIPAPDIVYNDVAYVLAPKGGQHHFAFNLPLLYGSLPDGHYRAGVRLTSEAGDQYVWYEFDTSDMTEAVDIECN